MTRGVACGLSVLVTCFVTGGAWQRWKFLDSTANETVNSRIGLGRRGHTLGLLYTNKKLCIDRTKDVSTCEKKTYEQQRVILFGGRRDDSVKEHDPTTYKIEDINGTLEFATYETKKVKNEERCTVQGGIRVCKTITPTVPVGLYFNDVWQYDMDCHRWGDYACNGTSSQDTWTVLDNGAANGGCRIVRGQEICTHPSERWMHRAEMFDDSTMLVYGGFSQRCEDYCDDMWRFRFNDNSWEEVQPLSRVMPTDKRKIGPGKRWMFSSVTNGRKLFLFGGHRLWHGFGKENSEDNDWEISATAENMWSEEYPPGGYLDDLWIFDNIREDNKGLCYQDYVAGRCFEGFCSEFGACNGYTYAPLASPPQGGWTTREKKVTTTAEPGIPWAQRNRRRNTTVWPTGRAGHVSVLDQQGDDEILYVHGGYHTIFPYPSTDGAGAGLGVGGSKFGFAPFNSFKYYLDDLWRYNVTSGYWENVKPFSNKNPGPRVGHVMVRAQYMLYIFGGYANNYYFDDTWQYNITSNRWLQQKEFVHAFYPESCTDSLYHRQVVGNKMRSLEFNTSQIDANDNRVPQAGEWHSGQYYKDPLRDSFDNDCGFAVCQSKWPDCSLASNRKEKCNPRPGQPPACCQNPAGKWMPIQVDTGLECQECCTRKCREYYAMNQFHITGTQPSDKPLKYFQFSEGYGFPVTIPGISKYLQETTDCTDVKQCIPLGWPLNYYFLEQNHYGCDNSSEHFSVVSSPTRTDFLESGEVVMLDEYKSYKVEINQARRQAPGWDGCRDRYKGASKDLPNELQWLRPSQRAWHQIIWSRVRHVSYINQKPDKDGTLSKFYRPPGDAEKLKYMTTKQAKALASGKPLPEDKKGVYGHYKGEYEKLYMQDKFKENNELFLVYGGFGFPEFQLPRKDITKEANTMSDMWVYHIGQCVKNCTLHGDCIHGHCFCHDGYYGSDCSNQTCPGSFCYYDADRKQHCKHCCSAGYTQKFVDNYLGDKRKIPCSLEHPGESHGICDGFGMCHCVPPYLGDDCSMRDCKLHCSGHGRCSTEYPVSRCDCQRGWSGNLCDEQLCLNNCSYPNGVCVNGSCFCSMTYSPFNRTQEYYPWMGDDCSWRIPYTAAAGHPPSHVLMVAMWVMVVLATEACSAVGWRR